MEILTWKELLVRTGSRRAAEWGIAHGEWVRVMRDAYVWADVDVTATVRLAALKRVLPPEVVIAGPAALWLVGAAEEPDVVDVVVERGRHLLDQPGCRVRSALVPDEHLCVVDGQRVLSAARACADLLRAQPAKDAVVEVDHALRLGVVRLAALEEAVDAASGLRGVARARTSLALVSDRSESPMETRLRLKLVRGGISGLRAQVDAYGQDGHIGRFDLWLDGVAIEFDGRTGRSEKPVFYGERMRQTRIAEGDLQLRRYTAHDVYQRPDRVVAGEVLRAVAAAAGRDRSRAWPGPDTLRKPECTPLPTLAEQRPAA